MGQVCIKQGYKWYFDSRKMEQIEFKPSHNHQSAIVGKYQIDINVPGEKSPYFPCINDGANDKSIGGELQEVGIDI